MYLEFHGFQEKPFNLTPDPRFVFLSKTHKEAFAHLLYGIHHRVGFVGLTGEVGSGKTTVLRSLLGQLDPDHYRTALIFNPCLSAPELLQNINREFGISASSNNLSPLEALNQFLLQQNTEGRTVVLIIDEAQDLEAPVLEQIRLISNLETDREKLIQIVLSGQPELAQALKRNEMRQLSQRIVVRYHLQPMDFEDTVHYVSHRLKVAGARNGLIFSKGALKRIYRYSQGLPRLVNAACDRALITAYSRDAARVDSHIASAGIEDMKMNRTASPLRKRLILIPTSILLAALIVASVYFIRPDFINSYMYMASPVKEAEEQTIKDPVMTGKEFFRAMVAELGSVSEAESARRAFNTLAGFWNVPTVPENLRLNPVNGMEPWALERDLSLYRFSGNLGALVRIDYPAALELTLPGIPGKRLISLVGVEDEQLVIQPPIAGRKSLLFSEIEKYWSGQALFLWKDSLNLLKSAPSGAKGDRIKQLQGLLKEAGAYNKPLTGVYNADTHSAVMEFQSSTGIEQDGIVGGQTLMLLYRSVDRFQVPRLTARRK
ncbi:MAG TPA: AAA family ATPase [Thermodesulfobacteriota bacterium]|nr:AAA family ATPase [Thermodesulfobacteriota bacterium]